MALENASSIHCIVPAFSRGITHLPDFLTSSHAINHLVPFLWSLNMSTLLTSFHLWYPPLIWEDSLVLSACRRDVSFMSLSRFKGAKYSIRRRCSLWEALCHFCTPLVSLPVRNGYLCIWLLVTCYFLTHGWKHLRLLEALHLQLSFRLCGQGLALAFTSCMNLYRPSTSNFLVYKNKWFPAMLMDFNPFCT